MGKDKFNERANGKYTVVAIVEQFVDFSAESIKTYEHFNGNEPLRIFSSIGQIPPSPLLQLCKSASL